MLTVTKEVKRKQIEENGKCVNLIQNVFLLRISMKSKYNQKLKSVIFQFCIPADCLLS